MRILFTTILFFFIYTITMAQNSVTSNDDDSVRVGILSEVEFKKSQSSNEEDKSSGIGSFGLNFEKGLFYGSVLFTLINQNSKEVGTDSLPTVFANNLLVPDKSGKGMSRFFIEAGKESFFGYDKIDDNEKILSLKRFGCYFSYQSNYTRWQSDSLESKVVINTFDALLTYKVFSLRMKNKTEDPIYFALYSGISTRSLGGNIGLKKNDNLRAAFLGNTDRRYTAFEWGASLEIGNVFAEYTQTNFNGDIDDFSGDQMLITFGITVNLNVATKEVK